MTVVSFLHRNKAVLDDGEAPLLHHEDDSSDKEDELSKLVENVAPTNARRARIVQLIAKRGRCQEVGQIGHREIVWVHDQLCGVNP